MGTILPELPLEPYNTKHLPMERIALRAWATAYGEACYEAGRQSVIKERVEVVSTAKFKYQEFPVGSDAFEQKVDEAMVLYLRAVAAGRPVYAQAPIVEALKWLRNETGCALKDAKEAIDRRRGV